MSMQITKVLQISHVAYLKNTPGWIKKISMILLQDTHIHRSVVLFAKTKDMCIHPKVSHRAYSNHLDGVPCLVNFSQLSDYIPLRVTKNSPTLGAAVVTWSHLVDYSCDKGIRISCADNHEEVALLVNISKSIKERKHRIYWKSCSQ